MVAMVMLAAHCWSTSAEKEQKENSGSADKIRFTQKWHFSGKGTVCFFRD